MTVRRVTGTRFQAVERPCRGTVPFFLFTCETLSSSITSLIPAFEILRALENLSAVSPRHHPFTIIIPRPPSAEQFLRDTRVVDPLSGNEPNEFPPTKFKGATLYIFQKFRGNDPDH